VFSFLFAFYLPAAEGKDDSPLGDHWPLHAPEAGVSG